MWSRNKGVFFIIDKLMKQIGHYVLHAKKRRSRNSQVGNFSNLSFGASAGNLLIECEGWQVTFQFCLPASTGDGHDSSFCGPTRDYGHVAFANGDERYHPSRGFYVCAMIFQRTIDDQAPYRLDVHRWRHGN